MEKALRARGFEVLRSPTLVDFVHARDCDLVVDVGGNDGGFAVALRRAGYRGRILSFEPIAEVAEVLKARAAADGRWDVRVHALGARETTLTLNVASNPVYSSFNAMSAAGRAFDDAAAPTEQREVPVRTLDAALSDFAAERIFLKIDTQGFERQVLEGARATLDRCVGLLLELPAEQLYEGVWTFAEAATFVEGLGFRPAQIRPVSFRTRDGTAAVEFDCVFRRAEAHEL